MTLAEVSAADKNAVGAVSETFHEEDRIDPPGAHDPDHAHRWRILEPGHTRGVSGSVTAPVA